MKACLDDAGLEVSDIDGFLTNQPLNDAHRSYAVRMANMARMLPISSSRSGPQSAETMRE